jgi:Protein of unknown function (DUF1706)
VGCRQAERGYADRVTDSTLRDRLLVTLATAREREQALLDLCDDSPPSDPEQWTAKDNVAHLNTWREHAVRTLEAMRAGRPLEGPLDDRDIDDTNAEIYAAHHADTAASVRAAHDMTYAALTAAVAACTDEELRRQRPGNGGEVWRVVPGNGHAHVAQHLSYWYVDRDDPAAAEAAAVWAHDLETGLFPDAEDRAVADYNLACFYARNRYVEEALPLIGSALRAQPDLRAWAAADPDLEPIRTDPRVQSLLGS